MKTQLGTALAVLSLAALGLCAAPAVSAQKTPDNSDAIPAEKRIVTLDVEDGDLYAAFSALFKQAKINYTLDPSLKGNLITAHIKLPLRQAIDTLIKISGLPVALQVENSVYSVVPKAADKAPQPAPDAAPNEEDAGDDSPNAARRLARVKIRHLNALDFAAMLGVTPYLYTNSLVHHGQNPFAPVPSSGGAAPGAAGGGTTGNGAAGSGANANSKGGNANVLLPDGANIDAIWITDMDAAAFYALFHGL